MYSVFNSLKKKIGKWAILSVLILGTFLIALFGSYSDPFRLLDLKIENQLFELRGSIAFEDTTVVLVAISNEADQEIPYKYPWPTRYYAKLVENLNLAGAKAIGFDVIFDKEDQYNPENDSIFAAALKKHKNVVLAGSIHSERQYRGSGSSSYSMMLVEPNSMLTQANSNQMGLVGTVRDLDDQFRRYPLYRTYSKKTYYPLGLELLRVYNGWEDRPPVENNENYFRFGSYRIPKYNNQAMSINYFGDPSTFPVHSFEMVIDDTTVTLVTEEEAFPINSFSDPDYGLMANNVFKDKIVLVGATMPALNDFHATPFANDGSMPGYEIHANAIQTILSGKYIYHPPVWFNVLLLLVVSIFIVAVIYRSSVRMAFLQFSLLALLVVILIITAFIQFDYMIKASGPLLAVFFGYLGTLSYNYVDEQREKQWIRNMFSTYLSPTVVNQMIDSGSEPQLGGDEVHITAFFSDIEAFSSFSEQMQPRQLVELINEYLSEMTDIIIDEGGTLDKYIGDAIVAFFGAPISMPDHAYKACVVSQLMQDRMISLCEKWASEGNRWPEAVRHMRNRIGINTGVMLTGNMGSSRRFNYTIMGDNVNLAARCESAGKMYGVYSLVTADTKREAEKFGDRCVFRYIDKIKVRGRQQPVDIYEIMGLQDRLAGDIFKCKAIFEEGVEAYQNREWKKAIKSFRTSAKLERFQPGIDYGIEQNPSTVYLGRCKRMVNQKPEEG